HGQTVAEPLMRELVSENGIVGVIAGDQLLRIARQRLMLAEAVGGELRTRGLLAEERIFAEALRVAAHDVRDDTEIAPRLGLVRRKYIEEQRHYLAGCRAVALLNHVVLV